MFFTTNLRILVKVGNIWFSQLTSGIISTGGSGAGVIAGCLSENVDSAVGCRLRLNTEEKNKASQRWKGNVFENK